MLCTTPLLRAMRQRWPGADIHVLANRYNASVLAGNPDVACVHTYVYSKQFERNPRPGLWHALRDRIELLGRLRRLRFDLLLIPNGGMHKNSIAFARQLGVADRRWHTAASQFDDRVAAHAATRSQRHEALSGFALLPELGAVAADSLRLYAYPEPGLQALWRAKLGAPTRPRVGLFISNKADQRRWPWAHWQTLAARLAAQAEVLLFFDPAEPPTDEQRAATSATWISTPTVAELIAAMSLLDQVVATDSLPVHLGAALQIPVVALFEARPEKYLRWYPLGVAHATLHAGPSVDSIATDAVEVAVRSLTPALAAPKP